MAFRHFLIASSLLVAPAAVAAFSPAAFADTSANVQVSGHADSTLSITATSLNPTLKVASAEDAIKVADLVLKTNNPTGLTLKIESSHNGLQHSTKTDKVATYSVGIGTDGAVTNWQLSNNLSAFAYEPTLNSESMVDESKSLYVKHDALANALKGDYSDTLTLTVTDKQ